MLPDMPRCREDDIVVVEMNQDVLGAPIDAKDSSTLQPSGKARRQRKAQIGPPLNDAAQAAPLQLHGQTAADGFDFGQFGHRANLLGDDVPQRSAPLSADAMLPSMAETTPPVDPSSQGTASFGFREVSAEEKPSLVRGVFESVADRYDLMNDLMSGGIHRLWKSTMIDWLRPRAGQHFIDVAGGTGDIAFRILERLRADGSAAASRVVVCDLTPAMLAVGRDRAIDRGILSGIEWVNGDAENLPFADRSFDAYTVAFGLRNLTHLDQALTEARRVLRPGGRLLCLEFSHVAVADPRPALRSLFFPSVAPAGPDRGARSSRLSISGGEHKALPAAG